MRRDPSIVGHAASTHPARWSAVSSAAREAAIYLHHGERRGDRATYDLPAGPHAVELTLVLSAGSYEFEWLVPATLASLARQRVDAHHGGRLVLRRSPQYDGDVLLRIRPK